MTNDLEKWVNEFLQFGTVRGCGIGATIDVFRATFPDADWNVRGKWYLQLARLPPFEWALTRSTKTDVYQIDSVSLYLDGVRSQQIITHVAQWIDLHLEKRSRTKHCTSTRCLSLNGYTLSATPTGENPERWYGVRADRDYSAK